jgi:hypothetical protein
MAIYIGVAGSTKNPPTVTLKAASVNKAPSYGTVGTAAGNKQFLAPSSPPSPPTAHFTPAVSGPSSMSSLSVGASRNEAYSASVSGSYTAPLSYNWVISDPASTYSASISGQGSSSIIVTYTGVSPGSALPAINVVVSDATGAFVNTGSVSTGVNTAFTVTS